MTDQSPLPVSRASRAVLRCVGVTAALLLHRSIHLPRDLIGIRLHFLDGTTAPVYRETVVAGPLSREPCVLVVAFRLRFIKGWGHAAFRIESILNTPLFVGFPGFLSKLWLANDDHGTYRGVYEWDGAGSAENYARSLWRVLALVSAPGSIRYQVFPGMTRRQLLNQTAPPEETDAGHVADWAEVVGIDLRSDSGHSSKRRAAGLLRKKQELRCTRPMP